MLIWVVAIALVGGFGLLGHQAGAIRWGVGFIGAALSLMLAGVVSGLVGAGLAFMGVKDFIDLTLLPGVIVFSLLTIIFLVIGVAAHRPVELFFKYRTDEQTRAAFERMNQAIGLFVGLISGICIFFSVGNFVYRQGYLITQVTSDTGEATPGALHRPVAQRNGIHRLGPHLCCDGQFAGQILRGLGHSRDLAR